jgi:hypothetical protein
VKLDGDLGRFASRNTADSLCSLFGCLILLAECNRSGTLGPIVVLLLLTTGRPKVCVPPEDPLVRVNSGVFRQMTRLGHISCLIKVSPTSQPEDRTHIDLFRKSRKVST